jgi:Ala-tRNA(Pro) deacylase
MKVLDLLKSKGIEYEVTEHKPTFSAQRMAAVEHEPGRYVAKPVLVKADGKIFMCVLDANHKIDLKSLREQLGAKKVELAGETEIGNLFGDCELGAEPPFGNLYDLPTIMDAELGNDDHIVFQAGSHDKAIRISLADYCELVQPKILEFSYHISTPV